MTFTLTDCNPVSSCTICGGYPEVLEWIGENLRCREFWEVTSGRTGERAVVCEMCCTAWMGLEEMAGIVEAAA